MFLRVACLVFVAVPALLAATPEVDSSQLPRVPATPSEKALSTFKIKPGFRLDLVAAEPLVIDPIAMSFDEDGRLYVVEMRDYSERRPERLGRIRLLEDTDGDGRFDKSTVFAENLPWPTAVTCWAGGVFVGSTPDILWMKDTNGDGVADEREIIFTGFAADYAPFATNKLNVQALMNSLQWTLDNRIHGATSFSGGKVKLVDSTFVRAWIKRANAFPSPLSLPTSPLDLRGRDFSFDPRTLEMRAESGGGQHGMSFDDRGRKFVCSNSKHIQMVMYEERYAARNPHYSLPGALVDIAVDGGAAPVFRISPDEPWRVIRTQWRVAGLAPGPVEGGGRASGYFTGATGVTIYRGDAYGPEFIGDAFIGDAGGNLVHRKRLLPDGIGLRAERPADEQNVEFLASTDNWFRPVQFANAPDGCLYLADMYREVIEHPWSLPESLKRHLDLNSGNDRGRIYRIVPEKFKQRPLPRLGKASTAELVKLLEHPNGWHRDTASRLLFERQDRQAASGLRRLTRIASPRGRLHALYTLHGQRALEGNVLFVRLADQDAAVREHALRLAERMVSVSSAPFSLLQQIEARAADDDPGVAFQVAFTMAELPQPARVRCGEVLLRRHGKDHWLRDATTSSLGDAAPAFFTLLAQEGFHIQGGEQLADSLGRLVGARRTRSELASGVEALPDPLKFWRSLVAFSGLVQGISRAGGVPLKELPASRLPLFLDAARHWATNAVAADGSRPRLAGVGLVGLLDYATAAPVLLALLDPAEPMEVQATALATFGRYAGISPAEELLRRWAKMGPALRGSAIDLLLKRRERASALLAAIERGTVQPMELSAAQQTVLRDHRDLAIRENAQSVLGRAPMDSRQAVVERFQPALNLKGDASGGRRAFQSRCASCHKLGGDGFVLGPDLVTVKNGGKEKLLIAILDPNREVNSNFLSYLVETKEGDSYVGIIASENAAGLTLRMAGGMEQAIARSNIAMMQSQGRSLMPEGLEEGLSQQDMADLLEFVLAQ